MSYGGYQQGYGQSNPYAQQDRYNGGYNQGGYAEQGYGTPPNMEMQPLNSYSDPAPAGRDPNFILNECQSINRAIDTIERDGAQESMFGRLRRAQAAYYNGGSSTQEIENRNTEINTLYKNLIKRLRELKAHPESGRPLNAPQIGKTDRRLKAVINEHQQIESEFRKRLRERTERDFRTVNPNATEEEIQAAVENPDQPVFQQALLNADRRGQASSTLRAVQQRHEEIQKIERQMIELAQLFEDLNAIVVQQEPMVENIEQKGEETYTNVVQANTELAGGIEKARSRNKKKWICLGICVLIILIIVIAVVAYIFANKKN